MCGLVGIEVTCISCRVGGGEETTGGGRTLVPCLEPLDADVRCDGLVSLFKRVATLNNSRESFAIGMRVLGAVVCGLALLSGAQAGASAADKDAPAGRSAEIMKHMFGSVKPYAYQETKPHASKPTAVVAAAMPASSAKQTEHLALPKQAVDEFSIRDDEKMPRDSLTESTTKPSAAPVAPAKASVTPAADKPKPPPAHVAPARSSATLAGDKPKPVQREKEVVHAAMPAAKAPEKKQPLLTKEQADKLFDNVFDAQKGATKKKQPEVATSLVEERSHVKTNDGQWIKRLRGMFKRTGKPMLNPALLETKVSTREPEPEPTPMLSNDRQNMMNTAQTLAAVTAMNHPVAHPVNSLWNPLNQEHTPQALTYSAIPDPNVNVPAPYNPVGSIVPNPQQYAGSYGVPTTNQAPTNYGTPNNYQSGYEAGLRAAAVNSAPVSLLQSQEAARVTTRPQFQPQRLPPPAQPLQLQQKPVDRNYQAGYEAAMKKLKERNSYNAGYEAALRAHPEMRRAPAAAPERPKLAAGKQLTVPRSLVRGEKAVSMFLEEPTQQQAQQPNGGGGTKGSTFNGNYLENWPPPPGSGLSLMTPMAGHAAGVAPAVPPPTPPQIGMAPAPPVSSRVSDTPDVLPQPTPSTDPSDVRFGNKRFPDQADAAGWQGNAAAHNPEEQGEPILNEPLMTPLSKPDTMEANGEIH